VSYSTPFWAHGAEYAFSNFTILAYFVFQFLTQYDFKGDKFVNVNILCYLYFALLLETSTTPVSPTIPLGCWTLVDVISRLMKYWQGNSFVPTRCCGNGY